MSTKKPWRENEIVDLINRTLEEKIEPLEEQIHNLTERLERLESDSE
jgi:uncharacterized protein YceH (UPF0502 family)